MLCKIAKMVYDRTENPRLLSLPKSETEINALLQDMGIGRENSFEYAMPYIKTGNATLDKYLLENPATIDELNHIAEYTKDFSQKNFDRLGCILEIEEPRNTVDLINVMHSRDSYDFFEDVSNMKELGEVAAFRTDEIDPDSPLGMCINFEAYGQSYHDAHQGIFKDGKYIVPPQMVPKQVYDGVMLPGTDRNDPTIPLAVQLVSKQQFHAFADEGIGDDVKGIWVKLPTTEYALDRIAHRLGENSADDCIIYNVHSAAEILSDTDCIINAGCYPHHVNTFAEILASFRDPAIMEKLEAVWEYEGFPELPEIINIACNIDCYNHDPLISSTEDFVVKYYDNDPAKLARADELDGEKLLARCGGKITENGFVARNEQPMEQIYEPPQPEQGQDQGITMQ